MKKGLIYIFTGDGKGKTSAALGVAMRAVGHGKRVAMVQWYKRKAEGKRQKVKGREIQNWMVGEQSLPELLKTPLFEIYPMGEGFFIKKHYNESGLAEPDPAPQDRSDYNTFLKIAPLTGGGVAVDTAKEIEHRRAAGKAMELATSLLQGRKVNRLQGYKVKKFDKSIFNLSTFQPSNLFLLILDEVLNAVNDGLIDLHELMNLLTQRAASHIILTGRNAPKELIDMADLVTEMKNIKHPYDKGNKAVMGLDF